MIKVDIYISPKSISGESVVIVDGITVDSNVIKVDNTGITVDSTDGLITVTGDEYLKLDLFDDEKISVTSSIQNINDISKTYTDFSQTFKIPASVQNNKIFKHWYDNSNDIPFSTLVKSDAYIEIDTIPFRKGKIQLESASIENNQVKNYSITFIGLLGNLKDIFAGKMLKDLTSIAYDFNYDANSVLFKVLGYTGLDPSIFFPLISSKRYWNYGKGGADDISNINNPIRYNELFPAIKLQSIFNMIETQFGINFDGTGTEPSTFLADTRFTKAVLLLKNSEIFNPKTQDFPINLTSISGTSNGWTVDLTNNYFQLAYFNYTGQSSHRRSIYYNLLGTVGEVFTMFVYVNDILVNTIVTASTGLPQDVLLYEIFGNVFPLQASTEKITFKISTNLSVQISPFFKIFTTIYNGSGVVVVNYQTNVSSALIETSNRVKVNQQFPEIKIEDFFSGILKMFNLTCYSNDGVNYTLKTLDNYYEVGSDVDITKYVIQDKKELNRVKTYKKINFDYEKSESIINFNFNYVNGIEYGSLRYVNNPVTDGAEYSIKLPFEDLNFQNLKDKLQVGYCLKTDLTNYIPKPIILYEYNLSITSLNNNNFYFSTNLAGQGQPYSAYRAFGQELKTTTDVFGLNFNSQVSTLNGEFVTNSLYKIYYENYFKNIFNIKARLIKVSAILPTSILTSLKLNDNIVIRDAKYLINTMNTDLTTGEVQFELLTDQRL